MVEIMAPAGSFEALRAAINAGADSVYFGVEQLNMRSRSANFMLEDLKEIVSICKENNVRSYLTLNTVLYDHDMNQMKNIVDLAKEAGITAIICMDIAAMKYCREKNVEVHLSTQQNISNIEAVKFFSEFADVVVLARELTAKQIKSVCEQIKEEGIRGPLGELVKVEIFVHGALCVAISGKCYMSLATYNASANRGACLQNCRREYKVTDNETGDELVIDNNYVMSPKDLCTIEFLDQIIDTGVSVLKIEGRGRSPDYVDRTVSVYKEAAKSVEEGSYSREKAKAWKEQLEEVYNRGFWEGGYYLGKKLGEWSGTYGSKAKKSKHYVGRIINYYNEPEVAEILIESGKISVGDELLVTGFKTGVIRLEVEKILVEDKEKDAVKGDKCTIKIPGARARDKVYVVENEDNSLQK